MPEAKMDQTSSVECSPRVHHSASHEQDLSGESSLSLWPASLTPCCRVVEILVTEVRSDIGSPLS